MGYKFVEWQGHVNNWVKSSNIKSCKKKAHINFFIKQLLEVGTKWKEKENH